MRILFLTFYFPPDLSACSFRATALVDALLERAPPGTRIDVLTTAPNRYHTFLHEASEVERRAGLEIRRLPLPEHHSDMLGQARAFASFARAVRRQTANVRYDLVFATSSRLMTAALGASVARRAGSKLYLDIRDIFADTIGDILRPPFAGPGRMLFDAVERWTVRRAQHVNLVSRGFAAYFGKRYPKHAFSFVTNGIDDEFVAAASTVCAHERRAGGVARIVYAGNIGAGQALHKIVPELARRLRGRAQFRVIGDGGRRPALEAAVAGLDNVELLPPMRRPQLLDAYRSADVLFLHLDAVPAFEKVLPSKVFEYASLGLPLLAGVAGYSAEFIRSEIENASVFAPTDVAGAIRAFEALDLRTAPRGEFVAKYARSRLSRELADDVLRVAADNRWSS
jgi:glycosyltransferase involved in cell wall biosynthesis